jgi:hypothetical protein
VTVLRGCGLRERLLHGVKERSSMSGPTRVPWLAGVADDDGLVDALELRDEPVVDALVDDEAAEGGAALAGGAHGGEGDGAEGEVEVGGGATMAALLPPSSRMGFGEAGGELGADGAAHGGRAGGGDERDEGRVDEASPTVASPMRRVERPWGNVAELLRRRARRWPGWRGR